MIDRTHAGGVCHKVDSNIVVSTICDIFTFLYFNI
jgi:hypothetical protein